jgi:hypothetical protein
MKMVLKKDIYPTVEAQPRRPGFAEQFLNQSQARGEFIVSVDQLAQAGQMTHVAVRRQLEHLSQRVQHLPGRPSAYLIVPPEHLARGAPPVAAWLDAYFRLRGQPYYVGLLSAAALHGSTSQALQVTQILTTKPMRPMDLGRLHVDFYVKKHLRKTPLFSLAGMPAPLAVSSPEATVLDLIAFSDRIGGIRRVTDVIADLKGVISLVGLRAALRAETQTSTKQRLGYVLNVLGLDRMAEEVRRTLPKRVAVAPLQTQAPAVRGANDARRPWMVIDNVGLDNERR